MSALVSTKAALQAIPIDRKRLLFCEENDAWYFGDPTSTAVTDGENFLAPSSGVGRYIKQTSANSQSGLIWQTVSAPGNFTAIAGYAYIFDFAAIGADLTVNLPINPPIGTPIKFVYASPTNWQRRLIINPNGSNIAGISESIFSITLRQTIDLVWSGSGWLYQSNFNIAPQPVGSLTTINAPNSVGDIQNGLIDLSGKQFNSGSAYNNPFANPLSNGFYFFYSIPGGISGGMSSILGDRNSNGLLFVESPNYEIGFFLPCNVADWSKQYPIRLSAFYWQGFQWNGSNNIAQIVIQGTNDFSESASIPELKPSVVMGSYQSVPERRMTGWSSLAAWETITIIPTNTISGGLGFFGTAGGTAQFFPVNSQKFYTAHRILIITNNNMLPPSITVQEIEMYGTIAI